MDIKSNPTQIFVLTATLMSWTGVAVSSPLYIPIAETRSEALLSIKLDDVHLLSGSGATTLASTRFYGVSVALGDSVVPIVHNAAASATVVSTPAAVVSTGAPLDTPTEVARFWSRNTTLAAASGVQPLFSRAAVISQAGINGLLIQPLDKTDAILTVEMDFTELSVRAEPATALSFARQLVTVTRTGAGLTAPDITSVGFTLQSRDGRPSAVTYDAFGSNTVTQWLSSNLTWDGHRLSLPPDSQSSFTLEFPLPTGSDGQGNPAPLELAVDFTQIQYSIEAPPAAAPRVAEQAGSYSGSADMYWDAATGTLRFDPLPLDTLAIATGGAAADSDPLIGGFLHIDPLTFAGSLNGRRYFTGREMRLTDGSGETLFRADLPSMVFDDSLFSSQGFNLFAPLLNIVELDYLRSDWLKAFNKRNALESPLLPELFIGFELPVWSEEDFWSTDFQAAPRATLSFAGMEGQDGIGVISAPGTRASLGLALGVLWLLRAFGRREGRG